MQKTKYPKTLCLVAGGSQGHINPALCIGKKWKEKNQDGEILFFSNKPLENSICLKLQNLPGKKFWKYPYFFLQFTIAILKSLFFLYKHKPEKIVSTGGLLTLPVCLGGKLLRIPIELHELNVIPGKAIKFLSPFAKNIFITFEKSKKFFKQKTIFSEYPLRFSKNDKITNKIETIKHINAHKNTTFPFNPDKKTLFLLGGSQGSLFLNNLLKRWIKNKRFAHQNIQIIHQTGSNDKTDWKSFYADYHISAHVFAYNENIKDFYLLSDLIICRGGAGTLFEIKFFQKKSIVIPLKYRASNHQVENAREMAQQYPELFCFFDQDNVPDPHTPSWPRSYTIIF